MLREYLEEGLQDIADKLENVKKEYYKNNNIADILNDKIEKSKSDMNADFSAFFPRSEQKDEKLYMSRFCEERNTIRDRLNSLTEKNRIGNTKKAIWTDAEWTGWIRKKVMFHVKHS